MKEYQRLCECVSIIRKTVDFTPKIALVLGSGLGNFASEMDVKYSVDYRDIPCFPVSTVSGHEGRFLFGYIGSAPAAIMQGRVHYYEGYGMKDVVMPVRILGLMGAKALFLTNAAGGINKSFTAGDFMLLRDHISFFVPSPLAGENDNELGARFPDMTEVYSNELRKIIKNTAKNIGINLHEGVYAQLPGPAYETPAEIRALSLLGADAVGMSTACEAIAARHMGLLVCGVSLISNLAAGISETPLSHDEVKKAAENAAPRFCALIKNSVIEIGNVL